MSNALVIIPTYNEKENIALIIEAVLALSKDFDILVVDDGSPDGTAEIVKHLQRTLPPSGSTLHVLQRTGKQGLGTAYIEGFRFALANGYDFILEMDADFSHAPSDVPRLLATLETHDQAMGSRYIKGGSTSGWTLPRVLISRGGNIYARGVLGLAFHDLTGGFNAHRRNVLETIGLTDIKSRGYAFQVEIKYRTFKKGFSQVEIPILFENRKYGTSKMSQDIVKEAAVRVFQLRQLKFS